jgi:cytoskeleton protein RodZ
MSESSPRGPGRRLREAREQRNLPVSRVLEQLRLDPRLLAALEADRWQDVGAPVFARGYIRSYAALVGLPAEELLAEFNALDPLGTAVPSLVPQASARIPSPARRRNPLPFYVAGVLALALAGLSLWLARIAPQAPSAQAPAASTATAAVPVTPAGASPPDAVALSGSAPAGSAPGATVAAAAAARSAAPVAAEPAIAASLTTAVASSAVAAAPVTLVVRFREQSWFEAYDAAGKRASFELAPAGARRSLRLQPPLRVLLGNAAAASLTVDGREARVPRELLVADTAWVQIDAAGAVRAAAPRRVVPGSD